MFVLYLFFLLPIIISYINSTNTSCIIKPCKLDDQACIEESVNAAAPQILHGIPSLGVESSDPLFIEVIEGDLPMVKYKYLNSTLIGLKKCKINNLKVNLEKSSLKFDYDCPQLEETGKYETSGILLAIPVQGAGDFMIITGRYLATFDAELNKIHHDGKTYLKIRKFKVDLKPVDPMYFDFQDLFGGQKDLSDEAHDFAHSNWQAVAGLIQPSAFSSVFKKMFSHVNKYLETVPLEEMILN